MKRVRPETVPKNDNLRQQFRSACEVLKQITQVSTESVEIDISDSEWFTPAFLSPTSVVHQRTACRSEFQFPSGKETYLSHINFPEGSSDPKQTHQNDLPLCNLSTNNELNRIESLGTKIGDLLSEAIGESIEGGISAIRYPISELIDNVDQHSRCENGSLLVQNYPSKSFIDICVADDGIGIPGSYRRHEISFNTHKEALRKALSGISTKSGERDRGYGIRTTTEIVCEGLEGEILLASGDAAVHKRGEESGQVFDIPTEWPGTVFIARLKEPDASFNYISYLE